MSRDRASIFDDTDIDLSGFEPNPGRKVIPRDNIKSVAEASGFVSREREAPSENPHPENAVDRRRRTGRNEQLNLKVTKEAKASFYDIADKYGLVLGDVFERAVQALSRELEK